MSARFYNQFVDIANAYLGIPKLLPKHRIPAESERSEMGGRILTYNHKDSMATLFVSDNTQVMFRLPYGDYLAVKGDRIAESFILV